MLSLLELSNEVESGSKTKKELPSKLQRKSLEFPYFLDEFCCLSFWVLGFYENWGYTRTHR